MTPPPVVIVGLGQLGAVFAEGFLRSGHPVFPVLRGDTIREAAVAAERACGMPPLVLLATGEDDLPGAMAHVPVGLAARVILLQNELRPSTWAGTALTDPTVCVVWFEKKPGKVLSEVRPSVAFGPAAVSVAGCLEKVAVTTHLLVPRDTEAERVHQLIVKNLYILGLNFTGLDEKNVSAGQILTQHTTQFRAVCHDLILLEEKLLQDAPPGEYGGNVSQLDRLRLERDVDAAVLADPDHGAAGRSAPRRLARTLALARTHGLHLEVLEALASRHPR